MSRKSCLRLSILLVLVGLSSVVSAATDYPSGYTKCAKEGETCSFSGTRSVAYGKAGEFVYANLSGPITCNGSLFPSINVGNPRYCSYSGSTGSGSTTSSTSSGSTTSSTSSSGGGANFNGNGRYQIISRFSGKVIDVASSSSANGANIQLWSNSGGSNQQWDIASLGGGYYSIRAAHSGKSMDVYNWCSEPGCEIRQWDYWGGDNQQWQITDVGGGYFKIISRFNGLALDVWEWNSADGADLRQWSDGGGTNQQWQIVTVGGSSSTSSSTTSSSSTSSTSSSTTSSSGGYGSTCNGGSTTTVTATIRVEDGGTFDGGCRTYNGGGDLGDGSQSEGQDPIFRVGPGLVRNVYIGSNGADGIHSRNGGDVDNIHWSDVGEDAMTIKDPTNGASVYANNIEGYDSADKFLQANDDATWTVNNCRVDNAGKFLRQNGGSTFPLHIEVTNCDISNMGEGIFRSDSPNSTARITNSRLRNAGSICIGSWQSCTSSGITNY